MPRTWTNSVRFRCAPPLAVCAGWLLSGIVAAVAQPAPCPPLVIVASRSYRPPVIRPAEARPNPAIRFLLPREIPVTAGAPGEGRLHFRFKLGSGPQNVCMYEGNKRTKYVLERCTRQLAAGAEVRADFLRLEVINGDRSKGRTEATLTLQPRDCTPRPPLGVSLNAPSPGTRVPAGTVVPVGAAVTNAQSGATARFLLDGVEVDSDPTAPYGTTIVAPDGRATALLTAQAQDGTGASATSAAVSLSIEPRPQPAPAPLAVTGVAFSRSLDGRVARDSALLVSFDRPVDASTLGGIRIFRGTTEVPLARTLDADGRTAIGTPFAPLAADALHDYRIGEVRATDGGAAALRSGNFTTVVDRASLVGTVLNTESRPLAGIRVSMGTVEGRTGEDGAFRLVGVPTGLNVLHIDGATLEGLTYPPLEFQLDIVAGIDDNGLPRPIFLPPLDLIGGLEVFGGVASGAGILAAPTLPGMSLDLRGVTVRRPDGSLFSGRMSITPVPPTKVPMPTPGTVYTDTFVTIQPGGLHLDPPATIIYPNLNGALPGTQVPLWHFNHEAFSWLNFGTATVSADGARIESNPGQGLFETGWGTPQPPQEPTTVIGRVIDGEDHPLHGVYVAAGNQQGLTEDDGTFILTNVPAGPAGQPAAIRVFATSRDLENNTFFATDDPVTAVQGGTTQVGDVKISDSLPVLGSGSGGGGGGTTLAAGGSFAGRISIHADYRLAQANNHILEVGSPHANEGRYQSEVRALRTAFYYMGFRSGGDAASIGVPLAPGNVFDNATRTAAQLFQSLELYNGNGGKLGGDGRVGQTTLGEINKVPRLASCSAPPGSSQAPASCPARLWLDNGTVTGVDVKEPPEPGDGYGTTDMAFQLLNLNGSLSGALRPGQRNLPVNDVSLPPGGDTPDHSTHETGINADVPLPRTDNGSPYNIAGWGSETGESVYDRGLQRKILQTLRSYGWYDKNSTYLCDTQLCDTEGFCTTECSVHHNHLHITVNPRRVPDGVNSGAAANLAARRAMIAATTVTGSLVVAGGSETDVPVRSALRGLFSAAFDPTSLTSATVQVNGPAGTLAGTVVAEATGFSATFTPVNPLDFATGYSFTVTEGAQLADGSTLDAPVSIPFTTEIGPSLRRVGLAPTGFESVVPLENPVVRLDFDDAIDPASLAGAVVLTRSSATAPIPTKLTLSADRRSLSVAPTVPLTELSVYAITLGSLRGESGGVFVSANPRVTFTTSLGPDVARIEVTPNEVTFTRANLDAVPLTVTAIAADGTRRVLPAGDGLFFLPSQSDVATVDRGQLEPTGNGEALVTVSPLRAGVEGAVRVETSGVLPTITLRSPSSTADPRANLFVDFSESVTGEVLPPSQQPNGAAPPNRVSVEAVALVKLLGETVPGTVSFENFGTTLVFNPDSDLLSATDYDLTFYVRVFDDRGASRVFLRRLPFRTGQGTCARGTLTYSTGPLRGLPVSGVIALSVDDGTGTFVPIGSTTPGLDGSFCLAVMPERRYRLEQSLSGGSVNCSQDVQPFVPDSSGVCGGDESGCENLGSLSFFCGGS